MDGRLALNPGSVAGPLNGVAAAQYAQLEWEQGTWRPELREVPYDLSRIRQAFVESGLLDEGGPLARAFLASIETGLNVAKDLLDHAYRLAAEAGYPGCRVVPDEIWVRTAAEFPWSAYQTLE